MLARSSSPHEPWVDATKRLEALMLAIAVLWCSVSERAANGRRAGVPADVNCSCATPHLTQARSLSRGASNVACSLTGSPLSRRKPWDN